MDRLRYKAELCGAAPHCLLRNRGTVCSGILNFSREIIDGILRIGQMAQPFALVLFSQLIYIDPDHYSDLGDLIKKLTLKYPDDLK